jgi:hypothetical protein
VAKAPAIKNITSRKRLEGYLNALPLSLSKSTCQAIALRSSLSVLPNLVNGNYTRNERKLLQVRTLPTLRNIAISRVALKYPTHEITSAAHSAEVDAIFDKLRSISTDGFNSSAASARFAGSASLNSSAAASAAAAAAASSAAAVRSAAWEVIQTDLIKFLDDPSPDSALSSPLWWSTDKTWQNQTEYFRQALTTMADDDPSIEGAPWLVWWDWYEPQINGGIP